MQETRPLTGIFWMVLTGVCFIAVTGLVKFVGNDVPAPQAAFLRYALGLIFIIPMLRPLLEQQYTPRLLGIGLGRAAAHAGGVILWFFAMTQIPIAEVTAMNYLSPVYVTLGAALFLGERLAARRLIAIAVAFLGGMLILRPGFREISPGHLAMLGTAILFAIGYLLAKRMTADASAPVVVGLLSLVVPVFLAPFALAVWVPPTLEQLGLLFLVAAFATAGHYTMTLAFAAAPLAVTQPVTFLQLIWSAILGATVFGEAVDFWVLAGGGLIIAAISFISLREAQLRRRAITPSVPETKV